MVGLLCAIGTRAKADTIYSTYTAGNGFGQLGFLTTNCGSFDDENAFAFTVPPDINYTLTRIDMSLFLDPPGCPIVGPDMTVNLVPDISGLPGPSPVATFAVGSQLVLNTTTLCSMTPSTTVTLFHGQTFWITTHIPSSDKDEVHWRQNKAGVQGPYAARVNGGAWTLQWAAGINPAFRVVGTPVAPPAIKPSYSSYSAPASGGTGSVCLEVICPGTPNVGLFSMPVSVSLTPSESPASICAALAQAINSCTTCPCWGTCPSSPAPYGFHADCNGDILRVTNSTTGLCAGAFICVDNVTGFGTFPNLMTRQLEGLTGRIIFELSGGASGAMVDSSEAAGITIYRTLRRPPTFASTTRRTTVPTPPAASPASLIQAMADSLRVGGDSVTVSGRELTFLPPSGGDYDVGFLINDTQLGAAVSPLSGFFEFVKSHLICVECPAARTPALIALGLVIAGLGAVAVRRVFASTSG